jgi:DNA-binding CsgD family transcriptional regulator
LLEQALEASAPGRERAEALFQLATVLGEAESHERSQELCRHALEELGDADDDLRAAIFLHVAWLEIESERGPSAAEEPAGAALRLAERSGRPELLAQALATVGWCELVLGRGVREDLMQRALALEDAPTDLPLDRSPTFSFAIQLSRIYELDRARPLLESLRDRARESGDAAIQLALSELSLLEFRAGNWEAALRYADESYELALQTGRETTRLESLVNRAELVLHLGRVDEARAAASEVLSLSGHEAQPALAGVARRVLGELELVLGNAAAAHEQLGTNVELNRSLGIQEACMLQSLPDDTEALIALGELDLAETQLEWLEERGRALDRPWALALAARSRGLLAAARGERRRALAAFERALTEHERLPMPFELGRTLLALGSVQRRAQQKRTGRETLERAVSIFEDLGARLWAERTQTELGRIGGRSAARGTLSATEQQIAELVAAGRTNQEVAEALSLSPRTVQWNLSKIYRKLGVRSRTELAVRLPSVPHSA